MSQFINIDLELSGGKIFTVVKAFAEDVFVLRQQDGFAAIELGVDPKTITEGINGFATLIDNFDNKAAQAWQAIPLKIFDIGIACDDNRSNFRFSTEDIAIVTRISGKKS
jgi:hypothetical protein